jgi:hypothetical protein
MTNCSITAFCRPTSFLVGLFLILGTAGCELINPVEELPAYIEVKRIGVDAGPGQGTSSSKITDVWVYTNGAYLGTFELPARIPVLTKGKNNVTFGAGIEVNGIASTRKSYPFYKFIDSLAMDLVPGEIKTIDSMTVNYFPGLDFSGFWMEDFEGASISMDTTGESLANIEIESLVVFEGQHSLRLEVTTDRPKLVCTSPDGGQLLSVGKDIYLELNYRCNQPFQINLNAISFTGNRIVPVIRLNPKADWNKIYIRLNPYINVNGDASRFQVMFTVSLPDGASQGLVYLDNIKLITN